MRTTARRIAVTATATALAASLGGGIAQAADPAPSSCRPANHLARITPDEPSAGHSHYRVTLTAAPGYAPCTLAGSPVDMQFSEGGVPNDVEAVGYGPQDEAVTFGPGNPVHFDIQVPHFTPGEPADMATYTLSAPDGQIPGEAAASGRLWVADGTLVGPMQPGA